MWKILSDILSEAVNKSNFKSTFKRLRVSIVSSTVDRNYGQIGNVNVCGDTSHFSKASKERSPSIVENTRRHEDIADFIEDILRDEVKRLNLNYKVSGRIVLKTLTSNGARSRHPDVTVVDKTLWNSEPLAYSTLFANSALVEPPQLVVEVVSTNWEDDYIDKLEEYQRLGIPEYWIVDYLALGSRDYLGNPKEAAIFVFLLEKNGAYQMTAYRGQDRIIFRTFPELNLIVEQVLEL